MEQTLKEQDLLKTLMPVLMVIGAAFIMVVIFYGVDSVAAGAHDAFHDFRHVIGMACH